MKRSRRRLSTEEREQAAAFKLAVQGRSCVVCGRRWPVMDAHHGVEAQWLRRNRPEFVYDARNAVPVCPWWEPCHGSHTSAMHRIKRVMLPESVEEFAAELGVEWYLERYYLGEAA